MGRPVMLGNGTMLVGLNEQGLVHDFYYPYVGLENLTNARSVHHMIGVWIDGQFSWVDDGTWETSVDFDENALISNISVTNRNLNVELLFNDFVDHELNLFGRHVTIKNLANNEREVRLFMHQVFQISHAGRADTALFEPDENYILDYKGRCSLLIYGQDDAGKVYDQFAIGNYGIEGKEGTFKDAEDGELSGSAVEHGGVDSVVRFTRSIAAGATTAVDYWIIASDSQYTGEKIHHQVLQEGLMARLEATRQYWHEWIGIGANHLHSADSTYQTAIKKSLMVIKAHTDKRGGIIASGDSSIYNYGRDYYSYVWPRDGAMVMWPLIRLGYKDEPKKFFEFCRDILTSDGYLMHKYQPDRAIGSTWHPMLRGNRKELPIQEDETAIVIYMLGEYYEYSGDKEFVHSLYDTLVKPAANFMAEFIDQETSLPHASYDLWEEKFLTNTYTAAITYQALLVAADLAQEFEHADNGAQWRRVAEKILASSKVFFNPERQALRKGYLLQQDGSLQFDDTLDISSLYGVMMFGLSESNEEVDKSMELVKQVLLDKSPAGGSPRYEDDNYFASDPKFMGNPWFVTTLWISQYYARIGDLDTAKNYLDWTLSKALPSGVLSEQINPTTGEPLSVTPLVWSHAELINTILDITKLQHRNQ